jgi:hypothetical protein
MKYASQEICKLQQKYYSLFLGAFAKLREATIAFVMSHRPSLRPSAWNNSAPTERILIKLTILTFFFFENVLRKFKFN